MRRREEEEEEEGLRIDLGRTTILQQVGGQWFGHTAVVSAADSTGHFKFKHSSLKYTLLKKGHSSKHTLIYFIIYSKLLKTAISYFTLIKSPRLLYFWSFTLSVLDAKLATILPLGSIQIAAGGA